MPELPEVETVVRGLRPALVASRFTRVVARRPNLRFPLPRDLGQRLTGARVVDIRRRAKYGLIDTDRGDTLIFHLGMSGRFRNFTDSPGPHDHVLFEAGETRLAYHDPRRFGFLLLTPTADVATHPMLARLGPEPLGPDFHAGRLAEAGAGRRAPVKSLLLDQQVVAGIGNIYACEALFQAGIHPETPSGTIPSAGFDRLADALRAVLADAIRAGGSTLRDHRQVSGESGYFQHGFHVYGREGQPCISCGKPLRRIVQSGRSSFFCDVCQPPGGP